MTVIAIEMTDTGTIGTGMTVIDETVQGRLVVVRTAAPVRPPLPKRMTNAPQVMMSIAEVVMKTAGRTTTMMFVAEKNRTGNEMIAAGMRRTIDTRKGQLGTPMATLRGPVDFDLTDGNLICFPCFPFGFPVEYGVISYLYAQWFSRPLPGYKASPPGYGKSRIHKPE